MSIFSKIFVVLVMVLSVLLVALIVPFVMNTENYRQMYETQRAQRLVAESNASNREAEHNIAVQTLEDEKDELRRQLTQLQNDLGSSSQRISEQQRTIIRLQNENADVRSQLARLSGGLEQQAQVNTMLQEEVRQRREDQVQLQTQAIELADALRERSTQVDTLTRQIRLLRETNTDLNRQYEEAIAQVESFARPDVEGALDTGFDPQNVIRGSVTHVEQIGDETYVALNVGANDTVREGMRFMIHRGDQHLGDAVITQVDENSAAGRVVLRNRNNEITADASVVAGLR